MSKLDEMIKYLKLDYLQNHRDSLIEKAEEKEWGYNKFLQNIIKNEYETKREKAKANRIARSKVPNSYTIETYPFEEQPHLNKRRLLERYESLDYITKSKNMIFLGATGTGKTGLASSLLRHALNNGYSGYFINFAVLIEKLQASIADNSTIKVIKKYSNYQCLLIDDLGYVNAEENELGLFYSLIQKRYGRSSTIITSSLGFDDWGKVLKNKFTTDALLSRLTDGGHIVNLKKCKSLRKDPDID